MLPVIGCHKSSMCWQVNMRKKLKETRGRSHDFFKNFCHFAWHHMEYVTMVTKGLNWPYISYNTVILRCSVCSACCMKGNWQSCLKAFHEWQINDDEASYRTSALISHWHWRPLLQAIAFKLYDMTSTISLWLRFSHELFDFTAPTCESFVLKLNTRWLHLRR